MYISNIEIKNFKTFNELSLDLNKFNVIIGACGSGKSNFVEIFELLNDISQNFHNAIEKHGGIFIKNLNSLETNDESCLKCRFMKSDSDNNMKITLNASKTNEDTEITLDFTQVDYEICFQFDNESCKVLNENIQLKFDIEESNEKNTIIIKNNNGDIHMEFLNDTDLDITHIIPDTLLNILSQRFKTDNIPLINSALSTIPIGWGDLFKNIVSYDFDPKYCKNIGEMNNNRNLTKHGDNLPSVLKEILSDEKKKKDFLVFYTNMLPYIKEVTVEKILDEDRIFMIVEDYNNVKIPSPFISDGTSTILAILVAFYFQKGKILLIEEPERHIHPSMIAKLMMMMESVRDKQVIITTHSPEVLKYPELEDIFFISRDDNGFSHIDKVIDNEVVRPFIDELGIDSVFVNNYMGLQP